MYHFPIFVSILINQVPRHSRASPVVSWHSVVTRIMVSIHLASSKVLFVFLESLEVCIDCAPRTTKDLKATMLDRIDKRKEKNEQEAIISRTLQELSFT
jgi:hypothetical protein